MSSERRVQPRAPSYSGLRPSSPGASRAKRANPAKNTLPERQLQLALRQLGLRFKTHSRDLAGRPDIVFPAAKLAVFCDGDFWHGRRWVTLKRALQRRANATYWIAKIGTNRQRDGRSRRALRRLGWQVISLWETDIERDPMRAALSVVAAIDARLRSPSAGSGVHPRSRHRRKGNTA